MATFHSYCYSKFTIFPTCVNKHLSQHFHRTSRVFTLEQMLQAVSTTKQKQICTLPLIPMMARSCSVNFISVYATQEPPTFTSTILMLFIIPHHLINEGAGNPYITEKEVIMIAMVIHQHSCTYAEQFPWSQEYTILLNKYLSLRISYRCTSNLSSNLTAQSPPKFFGPGCYGRQTDG